MAAYTIMAGSAFVVLFVFESVASLHTLQTREAVQTFLSEPPGNGLGMSVDGALTVMRTLGMVAAGCATAAGILGFHVLRRSKPARIALSVLALPLLVSGMVSGGFLSSLVAACAFLLWLPPARDWFEGREPPKASERPVFPPPTPPRDADHQATQATQATQFGSPAAGPRPMTMWGTATTTDPPTALPAAARVRPPAVLWACVLTWAGAGLGLLMTAAGLVYLALEPDTLLGDLRAQNPDVAESGLSDDAILAATFVTGGALILWALAAIVLAVLLFRGVSWSRLVLVVSTGAALALLAIGALTQVVIMIPFAACALTMTFLLRPETRSWVARR